MRRLPAFLPSLLSMAPTLASTSGLLNLPRISRLPMLSLQSPPTGRMEKMHDYLRSEMSFAQELYAEAANRPVSPEM